MERDFWLAENTDRDKVQKKTDVLNSMLSDLGVSFFIKKSEKKFHELYVLHVLVDKDKLQEVTKNRYGRPPENRFKLDIVEQMKAEGMTNKQIYEKLGISKSQFYKKMQSVKNNGQ